MRTKASAKFKTEKWDEKAFLEMGETSKMTRCSVEMSFTGDMKGDSVQEYVMYYREDGTGVFTVLERFVGSIGDKSGSIILQHEGTFDPKAVWGKWTVVPNSGTDGLKGLCAEASYELSGHSEEGYPFTFEYWSENGS